MATVSHLLLRALPEGLEPLAELALDLRWTWSHASDRLWRALDLEGWELTHNPWAILQHVPQARLQQLAQDQEFLEELRQSVAAHQEYLQQPGWYRHDAADRPLGLIAYFSMEFGLGEALPLYAGGLGILAGDYLKTASDLDVPMVGVGLLHQEGYFRQLLDSDGWQVEAYPYNDPISLPIRPVLAASGEWLRVMLELPGRTLRLRAWQAQVGRRQLYLLDSNDPLNSPTDRGITSKLYDDRREIRLLQEMALGLGGWRLLQALNLPVEVCHLNEGHAAFAVLERARGFMAQSGQPFAVALWATRAGTIFTTHTPVAAGFDTFAPELMRRYFRDYAAELGIAIEQLLALGRQDPQRSEEPFNTALLALRGSGAVNGVSRLHGEVSRRLFQPLYPRWPAREVPVQHVTNGVHVPSWDSEWADALWTRACGKERWRGALDVLPEAIQCLSDGELWAFRSQGRQALVRAVRQHLRAQRRHRGDEPQALAEAEVVLDPYVLTLGFARRFTGYKRPTLLLQDPERLTRLLTHPERPVQLVVAGKAHPQDDEGKRLLQQLVRFTDQPAVRRRAVFLEDYDMALAEHLVQGVDLWINTPRRPWEACGTSGMKVLVNGGLNLSELDGWWAEAYAPEVGWALGDGREHLEAEWDRVEAGQLYELLERQVVPEFYERDALGIPLHWVARMRASMAQLTPRFSSNRMLREYVEELYLPALQRLRQRLADGGRLAQELCAWHTALERYWPQVHFGRVEVQRQEDRWDFRVAVYLGELDPACVRVELYADPAEGQPAVCVPMCQGESLPGAVHGFLYRGSVPASRPAEHFTPRLVPWHPAARVPLEAGHILWQR